MIGLLLLMYHVMFGYRNKHTANDNTSGVVAITKILENLPEEHRSKVCVVYFDNEEKGLFGSSFFAKKHKKAPMIIAQEVVEKLNDNKIFSKLEAVAPGFINMNIKLLYAKTI